MHLSGDTYRSYSHLDDSGRNAFAVALWRLDQLRRSDPSVAAPAPPLASVEAARMSLASSVQAARDSDAARLSSTASELGSDEALVIEFARARALGRLREYRQAANAFSQVEASGRLLAAPAGEHRQIMQVFASLAETAQRERQVAPASAESLRAWSHAWFGLSSALGDSEYASLARVEAEISDQAQVEFFAARGDLLSAIDSCERLLHRHEASKLYPRHLMRLGDLYADVARREYSVSRFERRNLDVTRYERALERAFSAFELASETREPGLKREAESKIKSLLAYHEGVRSNVH